jgi:hypothetical protein
VAREPNEFAAEDDMRGKLLSVEPLMIAQSAVLPKRRI